jgi:hypothetical protein
VSSPESLQPQPKSKIYFLCMHPVDETMAPHVVLVAVATATSSKKTSISSKKRRSLKRNKPKKAASLVVDDGDDGETYYEIDKIVGKRQQNRRVEYLVRWKGPGSSTDSWLPFSHLSDIAREEALSFSRSEVLRQKRNVEAERSLGLCNDDDDDMDDDNDGDDNDSISETYGYMNDVGSKVQDLEVVGSKVQDLEVIQLPSLSSSSQTTGSVPADAQKIKEKKYKEELVLQEVERLNVHQEDAKQRVTEARVLGTPVVLVGHCGWTRFASPWLKQRAARSTREEQSTPLDSSRNNNDELDIDRMIEDIGDETVSILKKNYDESQPIEHEISASTFLKTCWPTAQNQGSSSTNSKDKLYLHQWQFPGSETAANKLCFDGNSTPLPNNILGEDFLQYLQNPKQNPYQYLFMGDESTMTKLHCDHGMLEILIAPIVGEKECVLVHRDDGEEGCLYGSDAKLDDIDLHRYPLMRFARIWKTVIRPGEILLLPHGTYHQCQNITPCLSYSKFHLDTVNLKAFLGSMVDGDAPEIKHGHIIWNYTQELQKRVENLIREVRIEAKKEPTKKPPPLLDFIVQTVENLRLLRHVCRFIEIRFEQENRNSGCIKPDDSSKVTAGCWSHLAEEIDRTLHEFQNRHAHPM